MQNEPLDAKDTVWNSVLLLCRHRLAQRAAEWGEEGKGQWEDTFGCSVLHFEPYD